MMCSDGRIDELFDKFWRWRLEDSPEFATFAGVHTYNDKLQSYILESYEKRKDTVKDFHDIANELLKEATEETDKRNLELFIYDLNIYLQGMCAKGYVFPLNYIEGVHTEFERLIASMPQKTYEDLQTIVTRFRALPKQVSEIIDIMKEGINLKITYHEVSVKKVIKQLDDLQKEPVESGFYKPFKNISEDIPADKRDIITCDATKALSEDVLPSFKRLKEFLENEYFKHLRKDVSITSIPNGNEYYQLCLEFHLGFKCDAQVIHDTGLKEVARISEEMKKIIASLGSKEDTKTFSKHMKEDKQFYFTSKEEILEAYRDLVFKKIKPKLPAIFKKIPSSELVIEPNAPSGIAAFYLCGTADGSRPGVFYVNTEDLTTAPKYDMMTLALHEAMPGHHLQLSYLLEKENTPSFQRDIEDRKFSEVPSRFPLHSAFIEGWGLYSEYLGNDLGFYEEDIYSRYGYLSANMLRACRLVVDTGIHAFGWSRSKAIEYVMEHTAWHKSAVENEINRYITWPGQACAYKIGQMKIKSMREDAEKELGEKFDIREFHDVVLNSFGPISFLEKNVRMFIEKCKA